MAEAGQRPQLTLEDISKLLKARVGSSWLALPDEEWPMWWRRISRAEADKRNAQIAKEWRFLASEVQALHAGEPTLLPRGARLGDLYLKLFIRALMDRPATAPHESESDQDFKKRQFEGRSLDMILADASQEARRTLRIDEVG